jgi:hypothetical protein
MGKLPAAFLDRGGILNRAVVRDGKPYPPAWLEDVEILPGTVTALPQLKVAGYRTSLMWRAAHKFERSSSRSIR